MSGKLERHGLSIGIERTGQLFFLSIKGVGKLTHDDYTVITPMLESALAGVDQPHIKVFFDMSEFEGWEARAAWDDFKLGLEHGREFSKIAILGNKPWQKAAAGIGNWFISGELQYFESAESALAWLDA